MQPSTMVACAPPYRGGHIFSGQPVRHHTVAFGVSVASRRGSRRHELLLRWLDGGCG